MELIKIYVNSLDVESKVLLGHFFRYLGFCIEEITEINSSSETEALIDIYIISDRYMDSKNTSLDIKNTEKSILIFLDGWSTKASDVEKIFCYEGLSNMEFFNALADSMSVILKKQGMDKKKLIYSVQNISAMIRYIAKAYLKNNILPSVLFTRCFYKNYELYIFALKNYINFIEELNQNLEPDSDLMKYTKTYAMFELNSICKRNGNLYQYSVKDMLQTSNELCKKYEANEQIHFLLADIYFELDDFWIQAVKEYSCASVRHCAYANYKYGRILRTYAEDNRAAVTVLKRAVEQKTDYFAAWYQLASCYENLGLYEQAVEVLQKIIYILNSKYKNDFFAPMELEYFYKTLIRIVQIKEMRIGDYVSAVPYNKMLKDLENKINCNKYLECVWKEGRENEKWVKIIKDEMKSQIFI